MEKIEKTSNQIVFATEIEDTLANSVRRYISQIPIMAVDEVEIFRNDSPLYDETIAHRIGLIPLKMSKLVNNKTLGDLKLVKKEGVVNSGDLKGHIEVVHKNIPITILNKSQELEIVATTKIGRGEEHPKFNPGLMFYRNASEIIIGKEFHDKIKNMFPRNEIKERGDKIIIMDNLKKEVLGFCEGLVNETNKGLEVNLKKDLIITIESFGQISSEEIFVRSVEMLKKNLGEISKEIK